MSKKRSKRILEITQDYEDAIAKKAIEESYENVEDQELFILDRQGSESRRKKVKKELLPKAQKAFISPTEQKIIEKIVKTGKKKSKYGENIVESVRSKAKKVDSSLRDLWDAPEEVEPVESDLPDPMEEISKRKKIRVPLPGQSYHPTPKDHQNIIAEAVAMEMKLKQAVNNSGSSSSAALIPAEFSVNSFHLNDQTAKTIANMLLQQTEEDDQESSDEESDNSSNEEDQSQENQSLLTTSSLKKRKQKLTTAELNRKKAIKLAQFQMKQTKKEDQFNKAFDQLTNFVSEIEDKEEHLKLQRKLKKFIKQQKLREAENKAVSLSEIKQLHRKRKALRHKKEKEIGNDKNDDNEDEDDELILPEEDKSLKLHDLSAIPLTDELNSSLRKVIPKGVAVKDYMHEMIDNR
jgi:hypothetical protein